MERKLIATERESALKLAASIISEQSITRSPENTRIGAAVLSSDDRIFAGAYIAGATSYTTVHAEAVAIIQAVAAGVTSIVSIALYASQLDAAFELYPCGTCLQLLAEYAVGPDVNIYTRIAERSEWDCVRLGTLLPNPWKPQKRE